MNKIEKLAKNIRSGNFPKEKINLVPFFQRTVTGDYIPVRERRIQVREQDRDIDRISRAVNKIENSGDKSGLEPLTTVIYSDSPEKILNGNHTSEIMAILGEDEADAYRVDFEKDLDSKESNCIILGNLLNKLEVEKVDVHENDIKRELYQIMDERSDQGLDPIPPDEIKQEIVGRYPHINLRTIGQWISNREDVGGRRKPLISYTKGELDTQVIAYTKMYRFKDYAICSPRTLTAWFDTGVGAAFDQMAEQKKKKALILLYCKTTAMADTWEEGIIQEKIKNKLTLYKKQFGVTIEAEMFNYE